MTPLERRDADIEQIENAAKEFVGDDKDDFTARLRLAYIVGGLGSKLLSAYEQIQGMEEQWKKQNRGLTEA